MANYRGHIAGAAICNTAYVGLLHSFPGDGLLQANQILSSWQFLAGLYIVAVLFGLWPDVDTNSKGQNLFFGIAFVTDILLIAVGRYEAAAYLGLLAMTPIIGRHRGWTHSKLAMILVPLPIVLIPYLHKQSMLTVFLIVYGAAVVGYFSHLLFDGLIIRAFRVRGGRYD